MSDAIHAPMNSRQEKRAFYQMIFFLVLPIALQNLINTAVSSADVVMLNYVGQEALAAVSLATQVTFVLNLFYFGISSGSAILTAQYWGKKDFRTIERIMGIAFRIAIIVSTAFTVASITIPTVLMKIFTGDDALIQEGIVYLRVVGISFLFMSISVNYLNIMRSMERVVLSTVAYLVSFVVNVLINAVLIFGLFGVPKMGVLGVAIGTTAARFVELVICLVDMRRSKTIRFRLKHLFEKNAELTQDFFRYSLPALGNEILWGTGFSMYTVIMGHLSSDAIAANSIVQVVRNLASVVGFGIANGAAVVIGKAIGEGSVDKAKIYSKRLIKVTVIAGIIGGLLMIALRPFIMSFAKDLTPTAHGYLSTMLWINAYYTAAMVVNTLLIVGLFRAGGDAKYGLCVDSIAMWLVFIPLGALCGYVFKLPVMWVYLIICLDEAGKMPFNLYHYFKTNWARNITRDWNT